MVKISKGMHLNMDAIIMETNYLQIKLIPEVGFKMASFKYIPKDKELLFQPEKGEYSIPHYGASFENYDTSGLDEMIPTIDSCNYKGNTLPDHGEVWSIPWDVEVVNNAVKGKAKLKSLPLNFYKALTFESENVLKVEYKVENLSNENIDFLWALHGLNVFDDETKILMPKEAKSIINVHENDVLGRMEERNSFPFAKIKDGNLIDLTLLKNYKDNRAYKYYFLDTINDGEVGLYYPNENIIYNIKYDPKKVPYLGIWITKGGFKGEYNCAIEPSTGYYDSLELAVQNNKVTNIGPYKEFCWTIYMEVKEASTWQN